MKLKFPVNIIVPGQNTSHNISASETIEYSYLDVTYILRPVTNSIYAQIYGFPTAILLHSNLSLEDNFTIKTLDQMLLDYLEPNPQEKLQNLFPKTLESDPDGPGSVLSNMISSLGIRSSHDCSCKKHAILMNEKGCDWCEENIDTIIGWLKEESAKRKLPFIESVAKLIVKRAIGTSRRLKRKQNAK